MNLAEAKRSARNVVRAWAPSLLSLYIRWKWDRDPEAALLPALCDRNRVSIDVGANWGQYSGLLPRFSAAVIACEPLPELATFLRRSSGSTVRVEQVALTNRRGTTKFVVDNDWGRSSLNVAEGQRGQRSIPVRLETLDSIAPDPVGFVKVDVEGHEEEVIEGAQEVIRRDHPVLLLEIEERHRPGALGRMTEALGSSGYSCFFLHNGVLQTVASFNATEHQNPANVPHSSDAHGGAPLGCYINNFLFIHESCLVEKEARLGKLGYRVVHSPITN